MGIEEVRIPAWVRHSCLSRVDRQAHHQDWRVQCRSYATLWITLLLTGFSLLAHAQQVPEKWLTDYEKSGYRKTPRYKETMEYCRRLEQGSPWIKVTKFGTSPEGRDLALVIASKDKIFDPKAAAKSDKAILLIQNGIHAGEIDGKDACLMLLRDIAITKSRASLLDHVILLVIPMYNVDGHERSGPYNRINQKGPEEMGWRVNSLNLNLNRDYLKADAPETQAWLKLFNAWLPDFFIDCHVTDGADFQYAVTYAIDQHENVAPPVRSWIVQQFMPMISSLRIDGIPVAPYIFLRDGLDPLKGQEGGGVSPPRFSTSYVPLQNRPGLLIETHMLKEYKIRVDGTYRILEATLRLMNEEHTSLRNAVRKADKEVAEGMRDEYALKYDQVDTPNVSIQYLGFKQKNEPSEISGSTRIRYTREPYEASVPRYDSVRATTLIRPPAAYIIPAQWKEVVERLKMHGVRLERLTAAATIDVEEYRFSKASWAQTPFEGRHAASYRVDTLHRRRTFPPGTIVCPLRQRAAKVAMHALEPQAPDAFAAWGFFDAVFEQKEYAEDYVVESMAPSMLAADSSLARLFREKLSSDPDFAKSSGARLNFFYEHSPYWDDAVNLYPVARLMRDQVLPTEPLR